MKPQYHAAAAILVRHTSKNITKGDQTFGKLCHKTESFKQQHKILKFGC